ncbi:uncharacterized protein LOC115634735 [Scaptodrosophila lebanonensis]|uniref:Uncharacterized protein LOC115634735 n=1 Tax=Drosophila lebanonensis TaxID=7225 RepID=A0A6J2UML4_DROLE|nr:uncharacterized protein LOC115634735 [Scaptodrosophila lebanonensis]XP_030388482.1 uncharacterized protein LOC115634735 [Scaptodrosophila lebanonensis]
MLRLLRKGSGIKPIHPTSVSAARCFAQKLPIEDKAGEQQNTNDPIKFFGSQAATWRARDTRSGGSDEALWYQPYVISFSLGIFLLYFCVLREESDVDQRLEGDLYDHVSGLEEVQLTVNYKYNKEHGLDTKEQEKRLIELGVDLSQLNAKMAAQ